MTVYSQSASPLGNQSICLSFSLSIYLPLFVCLSICLYVYLCMCSGEVWFNFNHIFTYIRIYTGLKKNMTDALRDPQQFIRPYCNQSIIWWKVVGKTIVYMEIYLTFFKSSCRFSMNGNNKIPKVCQYSPPESCRKIYMYLKEYICAFCMLYGYTRYFFYLYVANCLKTNNFTVE